MTDNLTPEQRRSNMSRIRSKDTQPEVRIRQLAFARGLRYYKHVRTLPGNPDIVFPRARVVVFVDGDFWHGWQFDDWKGDLSEYWLRKISGNIARDFEIYERLNSEGWMVVRIWEHEVKQNADACVDRIESIVKSRRTQ